MRSSVQIDTSHYAECSTLLIKFRRNHEKRLIALIPILLINFYLQTYYFSVNYRGESMLTVLGSNPELNPGLDGSLFALIYLVVFIGIAVVLFKYTTDRKVLAGYLILNGIFMTGMTIWRTLRNAEAIRSAGGMEGPGMSHLAFGYGILTLFVSILCIAIAFFSEQKRPKLLIALVALMLLFTIIGCFLWFVGAVMIGMYLFAIPEYIKMKWITEQPGYPYFNERFDQQQANSEYQPLHKLDNRSYGEMADIDDHSAVPAYFKEKEEQHRQQQEALSHPQMDYTMKLSDDPAEMPGIDEIFEHTEPLPEPEPPKADDIPDTKWDMPDTNWNVPEISSDIPDLPEIPDIPTL